MRNGVTETVIVGAPGDFQALMSEVTVVRKSDRRTFKIQGFAMSGDIKEDDLQRGRVTMNFDIPVVLTFRVEDAAGRAVPKAQISFAMPDWSGELICDQNGQSTVLGLVGHYLAQAMSADGRLPRGQPSIFEIAATDSGERLVTLKLN